MAHCEDDLAETCRSYAAALWDSRHTARARRTDIPVLAKSTPECQALATEIEGIEANGRATVSCRLTGPRSAEGTEAPAHPPRIPRSTDADQPGSLPGPVRGWNHSGDPEPRAAGLKLAEIVERLDARSLAGTTAPAVMAETGQTRLTDLAPGRGRRHRRIGTRTEVADDGTTSRTVPPRTSRSIRRRWQQTPER